jgi:hypothetical protein
LQTPLGPGNVRLNRHRNHREDFIHCVKTRETPIADVEIGHRTSTICQLGNICHQLDRRLKWDPVKEEFVNDAEANRLLSRSMRGEWRL